MKSNYLNKLYNFNAMSILLGSFLFFVAINMSDPIISIYIKDLGIGEIGIGLSLTVYSITKLLGQYPSTYIASNMGIKNSLILCLLFSVVNLFIMSITHNKLIFVIFYAIIGLIEGIWMPMLFSLNEYIDSRIDNGLFMGIIVSIPSAGMTIGALLTGLVTNRWNMSTVFGLGSIIALISIFLMSTIKLYNLTGQSTNVTEEFNDGTHDKVKHAILVIGLLACFGSLIVSIILSVVPIYLLEVLNWKIDNISYLLSMNFAAFAIFAPILGRAFSKVSYKKMLLISIIGLTVFLITLGTIKATYLVYVIFVIEGLIGAILGTSIRRSVSEICRSKDLIKAHSIIGMLGDAGLIIGPTLALVLYKYTPNLPFIVCSIVGVLLIITILIMFFKEKKIQIQDENLSN
ncbi:MFS transporter [Anaerosolibacter sp.]|uniref:MFS transporter n=1 Tax=Anaerosolibacter sp. TaxID=1872527 RepID=UPI0039EE91F3